MIPQEYLALGGCCCGHFKKRLAIQRLDSWYTSACINVGVYFMGILMTWVDSLCAFEELHHDRFLQAVAAGYVVT